MQRNYGKDYGKDRKKHANFPEFVVVSNLLATLGANEVLHREVDNGSDFRTVRNRTDFLRRSSSVDNCKDKSTKWEDC